MLIAALASVFIASCYDGDTCRTNTGERTRLACINTPELLASDEAVDRAIEDLQWMEN